jgi:hypothetical protein
MCHQLFGGIETAILHGLAKSSHASLRCRIDDEVRARHGRVDIDAGGAGMEAACGWNATSGQDAAMTGGATESALSSSS